MGVLVLMKMRRSAVMRVNQEKMAYWYNNILNIILLFTIRSLGIEFFLLYV
jgi:ribosomal protein S17